MKFPTQGPGAWVRAAAALGLCLGEVAQAGMKLQPPEAEPAAGPVPAMAPAPALAPVPAAPKARAASSPTPVPATRQDEKTAWSPCIRLINAAAFGSNVDAELQQALREHCSR